MDKASSLNKLFGEIEKEEVKTKQKVEEPEKENLKPPPKEDEQMKKKAKKEATSNFEKSEKHQSTKIPEIQQQKKEGNDEEEKEEKEEQLKNGVETKKQLGNKTRRYQRYGKPVDARRMEEYAKEKREAILKRKNIEELIESEEQIGTDQEKTEEKMIRVDWLPPSITEEVMRKWLESFGPVYKTFVVKTLWKTKQLIACYENRASAEAAISCSGSRWCDLLDTRETEFITIRWHLFTEARPHPEHKLFIGQLDPEVTEEELKKAFSKFGDIVDLIILKKNNTKVAKHSGFIKFTTNESAMEAIKKCHHKNLFPDKTNEPIVVRYAERKLNGKPKFHSKRHHHASTTRKTGSYHHGSYHHQHHQKPKHHHHQHQHHRHSPPSSQGGSSTYSSPSTPLSATTSPPTVHPPQQPFQQHPSPPQVPQQQSPPVQPSNTMMRNYSYMSPMAYFFHPMYMRYVPYPMMYQQPYFQPTQMNNDLFAKRSVVIKPVNQSVDLSKHYYKLGSIFINRWKGFVGIKEQLPNYGIVELNSEANAQAVLGPLYLDNMPALEVELLYRPK